MYRLISNIFFIKNNMIKSKTIHQLHVLVRLLQRLCVTDVGDPATKLIHMLLRCERSKGNITKRVYYVINSYLSVTVLYLL